MRPVFFGPWLFLCAACSSAPSPDRSPSPDIFSAADAGTYDPDADLGLACTDASPSLRTAVAPILAGCAGGELCHGFASAPFLHDQLVGARVLNGCDAGVLVDPGSLQHSYLLHKVTGRGMCPGSLRMPPGAPLAPGAIQTIADWICAGALND